MSSLFDFFRSFFRRGRDDAHRRRRPEMQDEALPQHHQPGPRGGHADQAGGGYGLPEPGRDYPGRNRRRTRGSSPWFESEGGIQD